MGNEGYFNEIKNSFSSLRTYSLNDNILTFYDTDTNFTYKVFLGNIHLNNLNPNLFLLKPRDIYRIIYMLTLLQKENNNPQELHFINDYVSKYLKLENKRLNNEEVDDNLIHNMEIPILLVDDPRIEIQNNIKNIEAKETIERLLKEHIENSNKGGQALVLRTKYYREDKSDTEVFDPTSKAGFTSFILILITIILTIVYIALFLNK